MSIDNQTYNIKRVTSSHRISTFRTEVWPVDMTFTKSRSKLVNGRLSAPPLDAPALRETDTLTLNWQELFDTPERVFNVPAQVARRFTVTPDGVIAKELDLDGLLLKRNSSKLLVVFHGALARDKFVLPRFEYQRALKDFEGSILFLQDPTLYVHKELTLGWYVGSNVDNGHTMIQHLINTATNFIKPEKVLLTGSSGGGFAALAISARIDKSTALVFSPQTAIENYYTGHRRRLISSAFPGLEPNFESLRQLEDRLDMGALYSKGTNNKVLYLQNTGDPTHLKKHCLPFMRHTGLDLLEGEMRNERIKVEFSFLREGHGGPTASQMRQYVNKAFSDKF